MENSLRVNRPRRICLFDSYRRGPHSREGAWKEFATAAAGWTLRGYGSLSVTDAGSGAYLGEVGIYHLATYYAPEIGWMVLPEAEGRGIAAEAARALRDWAYATQSWTTLVSHVHRVAGMPRPG